MFLDKGLIDQIRYVAYVHGMAGNKADTWGLSHLEPPPALESKSGWCANMFLDKGFEDQMLPMRTGWQGTMQNHADRWGLSHFEPSESQATLAQSSQIGVPACFRIRVIQIRLGMLPMRTGWKGTRQIGWGLSYFEPPKSPTPIELKSFQVVAPKCFLIRVF